MILLNFSHPLTPEQKTQVEALANQALEQVLDLPAQFDHEQPFQPQLQHMLASLAFTPEQWQTAPILVNLPSYNYITALLLAELHGRMGYFPPVLRLKPAEDSLPPRFDVAEVINLQSVRAAARRLRY